jgi:hypothetical protein
MDELLHQTNCAFLQLSARKEFWNAAMRGVEDAGRSLHPMLQEGAIGIRTTDFSSACSIPEVGAAVTATPHSRGQLVNLESCVDAGSLLACLVTCCERISATGLLMVWFLETPLSSVNDAAIFHG